MEQEIKISKGSQYYLALCKVGVHVYLTAGIVNTNTGENRLLSIFGKNFTEEEVNNFQKRCISLFFRYAFTHIKSCWSPWAEFKTLDLDYDKYQCTEYAVCITQQQYEKFLRVMSVLSPEDVDTTKGIFVGYSTKTKKWAIKTSEFERSIRKSSSLCELLNKKFQSGEIGEEFKDHMAPIAKYAEESTELRRALDLYLNATSYIYEKDKGDESIYVLKKLSGMFDENLETEEFGKDLEFQQIKQNGTRFTLSNTCITAAAEVFEYITGISPRIPTFLGYFPGRSEILKSSADGASPTIIGRCILPSKPDLKLKETSPKAYELLNLIHERLQEIYGGKKNVPFKKLYKLQKAKIEKLKEEIAEAQEYNKRIAKDFWKLYKIYEELNKLAKEENNESFFQEIYVQVVCFSCDRTIELLESEIEKCEQRLINMASDDSFKKMLLERRSCLENAKIEYSDLKTEASSEEARQFQQIGLLKKYRDITREHLLTKECIYDDNRKFLSRIGKAVGSFLGNIAANIFLAITTFGYAHIRNGRFFRPFGQNPLKQRFLAHQGFIGKFSCIEQSLPTLRKTSSKIMTS